MTMGQAIKQLVARGVYFENTAPTQGRRTGPDGTVSWDVVGGRWSVYQFERGQMADVQWFETEAEAAAHVLQLHEQSTAWPTHPKKPQRR